MSQLGSFSLLLALGLSVYSFLAGAAALFLKGPASARLAETARRAGIVVFFLVVTASAALVVAAFTNDFSIAYIAQHSNIDLPAPYKFAVLWSGQEGSLLFWCLLLSAYGFVLRLRHKTDVRLFAHASVIIAAIQIFFLLLVVIAAKPFGLLQGALPQDGNGLNPLLQYPEMVIHPPMLYLGYVGFSVPFAFALGALIMKYPGEKWIHITRRWTMVTWGFLTIGVFLGMHWAYVVLGWGGYWGWDPVENASFMPWLTGTAFLHSVMMQEKRGMLKVWNVWLIFTTFLLSILGTFLTRSGVVNSVHAFAESSIGNWFLVFMLLTVVTCFIFFVKNRSHLRTEHRLESLVSRESSFLFNNLLLLLACFTVFLGTLYPVLSEWVKGVKQTVGPAFFNRVNVPIALLLLLLTAVGPLLAWGKTSLESLKRNFLWPTAGMLGLGVLLLTLGFKPWQEATYFYSLVTILLVVLLSLLFSALGPRLIQGKILLETMKRHFLWPGVGALVVGVLLLVLGFRSWQDPSYFYSLLTIMLSVLVILTVAEEFIRGGHVISGKTGQSLLASMVQLTRRNTRRYGGYIVHFGVVVIMIGFAGSAFNQNKEQEMGPSDQMTIGPYTLVSQSTTQDDKPNYGSDWLIVDVFKGGKQIGTMYPEERAYKSSQQTSHIPAIRSTLKEDLYLVYEGQNDAGRPMLKAFLNPLVMWVWLGFYVMVAGTALALVPNAAPVRVPARAQVEVAPVAVGD